MAHQCKTPDPDNCFGCKLIYWRENGAPGVTYQMGREKFHNSTIKQEQDKIVKSAAKRGIEAVPYKSIHG